MEEIIYHGAGSPQEGQIKEVKVLPDKTEVSVGLSKDTIIDIKLKAIATKLGVDLDAAVAAAESTNG